MQVTKVLLCFIENDSIFNESTETQIIPARTQEQLPPSDLWTHLKKIPFLVQLEFSDGTLVAIDDLLRSEHRFHLTPQQRILGRPQIVTWTMFLQADEPLLKGPEENIYVPSFWSYEFILTYLDKYKDIPCFFVNGLDPRQDRSCLPIEKVQWAMRPRTHDIFTKFKNAVPIQLLADIGTMTQSRFHGLGHFSCDLSYELKASCTHEGVGYFFDQTSQTLYVNDLLYFQRLVLEKLKTNRNVKISHLNKIEIIGSQNLSLVMDELKKLNFKFGRVLQEKHLNAETCALQVWIYESGVRLGFSLSDTKSQYCIWNLSVPLQEVLQGWELGFRAFLIEDNIISKIRKYERGNDLRFIRHVGIFNLYLFEILHYFLHGEDSLGQPYPVFMDLVKTLHKRAAFILMSKEGFLDPQIKLNDFCSSKLIHAIEKWCEKFYQETLQAEVQIYVDESSLKIKNFIRFQFKVLYYILKNRVVVSEGDIFLKSQAKYHPKSIFQSNTESEGLIDHYVSSEMDPRWCYSYALQEHFQLMDWVILQKELKDVEIYYNGKKLEELEASRLKTQLDLVEDGQVKNDHIDWFELNPRYFLDGQEVPKEKLENMRDAGVMEFQGKYYLINIEQLPSLKLLNHFWAKIQSKKGIKQRAIGLQKNQTLRRHQTLELLALRRMGVKVEGGARWQEICAYYDRLSDPKDLEGLFKDSSDMLKPFQKIGVSWLYDLYNLGLGGVLADDMGLGKTAQTLSVLQKISAENESPWPHLIVVPTSLTYNWMIEAEKFTPDLKLRIFDPKQDEQFSPSTVYVTTYGLLLHHKQKFVEQNWHLVIFDEAQNLKTWNSQRAVTARELKAQTKYCLTGTPLENHIGELYSIMNVVAEGVLGSKEDFYGEFVNKKEINQVELDFLKLSLKPLILRRHKSEILKELPEKIESSRIIPFSEKQKKIYRDVALSCNEQVQKSLKESGENRSQLLMLTALLRLRQICSDPAAVPQVEYNEIPPKVEAIVESLKEILEEGHSVLIFTQFIATYERLIKEIKQNGMPVLSINGATSRKDRESILQEFKNSDQAQCLLMTLKTGGVGLNLTKASYIFHVEPWWNPAVENQATDRAHRMGQEKTVNVYRLIMKDSVEEKIEILKKKKVQLFNSVFDSESFNLTPSMLSGESLRKEDFDFLLDLRPLG